ncbi:MAG: twin-arginine translocation signal domain-containing protein [Pseudomonadota bacterium]
MDEKDKKAIADRRSFLKLAGLGAVSGGAALVADAATGEANAKARPADALYRETDHVKRYYELAKFF